MEPTNQQSNVIGNHTPVAFAALGNVEVTGKVDTGATTSSLHATNIKVNGGQVSFVCDEISPNVITVDVEGAQTVHTADNGGDQRPMVKLDISVNGVNIPGALFNLNDRSNMDSKILLGQNILQAGHFVVDVNQGNEETPDAGEVPDHSPDNTEVVPESVDNEEKLLYAIKVLAEADITVADLLKYLQTAAVSRIQS
jgi:hypothetical protein